MKPNIARDNTDSLIKIDEEDARMKKNAFGILIILSLFIFVTGSIIAQDESPVGDSEQPVVFAVLFYSPTCSHCHEVIQNHLPDIVEEFGNQLKILFIDITKQSAGPLAWAAFEAYDVPEERRGSVPMMFIGDEVLSGSIEIPTRLPEITRAGLAAGGIGLPAIPGLQEIYEATLGAAEERAVDSSDTEEVSKDSVGATTDEVNTVPLTATPQAMTLQERIAADPANLLAVMILGGLIISVGWVLFAGWHGNEAGSVNHVAIILIAIVGVLVALSLVAQESGDVLAKVVAGGVIVLLGIVLGTVSARWDLKDWLIPVVALAGLGVAVYMSHIEMTHTEATCGLIGNCNTVQQSGYAYIFGVIPIGVLGIVGYVVIAGVWLLGQVRDGKYRNRVHIALLTLTLIGTVFSIYLTYLEPFVIGASCAWCLTSALTMVLLLWLVAEDGWLAFGRS